MQVHVLASGSKGNAAYIEMAGTRLLIDAGISARRIKQSLASIDVAVAELDGVLITHEHRDHINGLVTLTKQYQLPIYTRAATFQAMFCRDKLADECCMVIGDAFTLGSLQIEAFNIPHDAADPVGFRLHGRHKICTFATDLGFVTSSVQAAIDYTDVLILEANHDVGMLRKGSYPYSLKQRILGNRGHLSNEEAAWALVRMKKNNPLKVFLAHLSEENNCPRLVRETVQTIVERQGVADMFDIKLARPDEVVSF